MAETFGRRLTAFTQGEGGTLTDRQTWASFGEPAQRPDIADFVSGGPGAPDGLCGDAEGAVRLADALGARVLRVAEGGQLLEEVPTGTGVFACMLGGEDRRTLYLCTAPSFAEHERRDTREAQLLSCRVDVPGAGLP